MQGRTALGGPKGAFLEERVEVFAQHAMENSVLGAPAHVWACSALETTHGHRYPASKIYRYGNTATDQRRASRVSSGYEKVFATRAPLARECAGLSR